MSETIVRRQSPGQALSYTVVVAVSEYKGVDEFELDPPLYQGLDPDSLDILFRGAVGSLQFDHWGCTITVDHNRVVTIRDADNR
jgi:hypothetical protein